jgi:nitrous oxidase accessory protein NosD
MSAWRHLLPALALAAPIALAAPVTRVVCAAAGPDCEFRGGDGIQAAVDAAADGDTILLRAGRYTASRYREVPYREVTVRGFVVIDGKDLTLAGEAGAVLDGSTGVPTTAVVVRAGTVAVRSLEITGFRYDVQEDDYYEGHGLFVIDGQLRVEDVSISQFQKMGLVGRGASVLLAERLEILDGHVGIWLHETAYLSLVDSVVSRNDSSAIAAYDDSVAQVANCTFERNLDDGLFTEHRATLYASGSRLLGNAPYGARASGDSTIWLIDTRLEGNRRDTTGRRGRARVRIAPER